MRISWLAAEEIAVARQALSDGDKTYDDHFGVGDAFTAPPLPEGTGVLDWDRITEHVARAERVSTIVRDHGIDAALARFGESTVAIEAATLAAALHEGEMLDLERVIRVLGCAIDPYVFYAPFLELLISLGAGDQSRALTAYELFVDAYVAALTGTQHARDRIGAVRDGFADILVSAGRHDEAEALFQMRHEEDQQDVAVALTASRAFLAAGSISHAVRWLGIGAGRAAMLGPRRHGEEAAREAGLAAQAPELSDGRGDARRRAAIRGGAIRGPHVRGTRCRRAAEIAEELGTRRVQTIRGRCAGRSIGENAAAEIAEVAEEGRGPFVQGTHRRERRGSRGRMRVFVEPYAWRRSIRHRFGSIPPRPPRSLRPRSPRTNGQRHSSATSAISAAPFSPNQWPACGPRPTGARVILRSSAPHCLCAPVTANGP